ncbi:lauroyl-Kdo(2)-lipid IV(A) myristoyltransferase [Erwinia tracheiphila]|uniref:Lipid A biosynthesis acyltransferase n=1 Tax=Erwinia tracheiphila TaxID=65700 RepID=A0A0M2KFS5_9GAMM|nr:lauroyl-Kdo(2)-lipid IV(A) myristoyltransferase [Erwinia tracheiphila]EOS93226.1 lipid A biosynthesis (KDO)2-(lauroyl)-lipid IVA acyltransferase [Erwinia tracheiphila PSU-1]KKF35796.1 lipid A biosynthesis (KDO)2-(lauroyl)-lipid IVA acyltransferase [Erwinia tracheiphila]UIA86070.1 lauroyl-Kdo(2)-lipid IV(A) myristoyltransferase [Erwinia tracheiphila]UIA98283.1 lauroyl-Kdo(2)-lipid IV(A) myristoyltransferase [Erwinia tracheiphila]
MDTSKKSNIEFIPVFQRSFLLPRYWGSWLALGACVAMAWVPGSVRDPLLGAMGRLAGKFAKSARRRAQINLFYCMPDVPEAARESIIDQMFAVAPQSMVMMAEMAMRPERTRSRIIWHNREIIDELQASGQNVIFLVPHGWAVDIPAMLLASEGQKMAAMFHNQRNPLLDYLWNAARRRFGGRLHARNDGIKPFISSVRQGFWGYYLPDQDHGAEHSEFVDFFSTYKATLPAVGRLMKVCRARVVPLFPVYNDKTHQLEVHIRPPMDDLFDADDRTLARRMNEEVEIFVGPNPEQYTWILKLLKTRKDGEIEPYRRKDLFRKK